MNASGPAWYIPGEGKQPTGPFTAEQLIQSWRSGQLDPNTVCWREGMSQWLPMAQIEPFASAMRAATVSRQAAAGSTSQPLSAVQTRTPSSAGASTAARKASQTPLALKFLPVVLSVVAVAGLGMAYLLFGGFQRDGGRSAPARETASRSASAEPRASGTRRNGPTDKGKINEVTGPLNQPAEKDKSSAISARPEEVATHQPPDSTASSESLPESNITGPSKRGSRKGRTAPGAMSASPASSEGNELVEVPGVRSASRFIEPPMECACPCWSPDGKYVMYVARAAGQLPGGAVLHAAGDLPRNIWVISADGSKKWLVSNFFFGKVQPPNGRVADPMKLDVTAVSWSPDGQRIAFLAYEGEQRPIGLPTNLYIMKADATDIFRLADKDCNPLLQWTPDGKGLLFNPRYGAPTLTNVDGTDLRPLTGSGGSTLEHACSSRDGTKIVAVAKEMATMGLCVISKNSRQVKWLTRAPQFGGGGISYFPRSWSPDARQIAAGATNDVGQDRHIAVFDVASGNVRRLVDGAAPSWSPDGKRIVFEGGLGDQGNLYLIDPDAQNLQRITSLTPPGAQMIWGSQPRCSPDGKRIVFRRGQHVWVANLDGSGQMSVIQGTDFSRGYEHAPSWPCKWAPFWKPDGNVVFARYSKRDYPVEIEVCATGVDSARVRPIFVWKSPTVALKSPDDPDDVCWSPDGTKVAFDNNQNIWVAKGDGTDQRRLVGGRSPQWSPDGERVLFARGSEHNEVLCVVNADGSNQTQITDTSDGYRAHHRWCPDGKTVAFEGKNGLMVASAGGGNARRLVWGQQPCWSPDGRKMAFCAMGRLTSDTGASGSPCVYVMNADGTEMRPVMQVDSTAYGNNIVSYLSWSADGKHIVFEETARRGYDYENRHHIWIVDVSEPVFYQSSYMAPDLPAWKVPQFEGVPQPNPSEATEDETSKPRAKRAEPADEKATDQGPLTGTWQASSGAKFRIVDDGKALTVSLVESDSLREFGGKLTRRGGETDSKSFTGTLQAVFAADASRRHSISVTATLDESGQLRLRCSNWPTGMVRGKVVTRPLNETWTRQQ